RSTPDRAAGPAWAGTRRYDKDLQGPAGRWHRAGHRPRPARPVRAPAQRHGAAAVQALVDEDRARLDRAQHLRAAVEPGAAAASADARLPGRVLGDADDDARPPAAPAGP